MMWRRRSPRGNRAPRARVGRASIAVCLALLFALAAAAPASAGNGTWTRIGLKGVGLSAIAASPTNPNVLIAGGGAAAAGDSKEGKLYLYRSADRGKTWTSVAPAIKFGIIAGWSNVGVGFVEFDPKDANVVYANIVSSGFEGDLNKGTGLYRSADGGKSWRLVYEGNVTNLAISPADPSTVYLAAHKGTEPGCYKDPCPTPLAGNGPEVAKSVDRGLTWQHLTEIQEGQFVAVSPTNANALFVGGYSPSDLHLLHSSSDGGRTWTALRSLDGWIAHPTYDRSGSTLFVAFTSQGCAAEPRAGCKTGIVRSKDGGRDWEAGYTVDNPAPNFEIESILPDPLSDGVVFVATRNSGSTVSFSVRRSADSGSTFAPLGSAFQGLGPNGLALDGANPETLYAATPDGIWAYTFAKVAVATATPTAKAAATQTTPPIPTATAIPPAAKTPTPTAATVATATRVATATATPTPAPPIAMATVAATATATPSAPSTLPGDSALAQTVVLVGGGAALLAVGAIVGRRFSRHSP